MWAGLAVGAALAVPVASKTYTVKPFEHYQAIIDRAPFGPMAKDEMIGGDPSAASAAVAEQLTKEQEILSKQIKMSGITVMPDGVVAVGFSDLSSNPPLFHFLRVGEKHASGWLATDASYRDEWATIEKDGVEVTIQLGRGVIPGPPTQEDIAARRAALAESLNPKASKPQTASLTDLLPSSGGIRTGRAPVGAPSANRPAVTSPNQPGADGKQLSYAERLRMRSKAAEDAKQVAALTAKAEAEKKIRDEEEARERAVNLELLKRGVKPRSEIILTPEEDKELVEQGVLPAS